jgi:hypothetical protein
MNYCLEAEKGLTTVTGQRDRLQDVIDEYAEDKSRLATMAMDFKEQRDRLVEALERILSYQGRFAEEDPESIATEALQSLTPNEL